MRAGPRRRAEPSEGVVLRAEPAREPGYVLLRVRPLGRPNGPARTVLLAAAQAARLQGRAARIEGRRVRWTEL